jgi:hypothetical protein
MSFVNQWRRWRAVLLIIKYRYSEVLQVPAAAAKANNCNAIVAIAVHNHIRYTVNQSRLY